MNFSTLAISVHPSLHATWILAPKAPFSMIFWSVFFATFLNGILASNCWAMNSAITLADNSGTLTSLTSTLKSLPNFFLRSSSNSLSFAQFFHMSTPILEVKMIISPSLAVFLTTTLLIPDLGKVFSIKFLILISSTKKSVPVLLVLLNHSHGRDLVMPTLIPIGLTFCPIITFEPNKIFSLVWTPPSLRMKCGNLGRRFVYFFSTFLAFGALTVFSDFLF